MRFRGNLASHAIFVLLAATVSFLNFAEARSGGERGGGGDDPGLKGYYWQCEHYGEKESWFFFSEPGEPFPKVSADIRYSRHAEGEVPISAESFQAYSDVPQEPTYESTEQGSRLTYDFKVSGEYDTRGGETLQMDDYPITVSILLHPDQQDRGTLYEGKILYAHPKTGAQVEKVLECQMVWNSGDEESGEGDGQ